MHFQLNRTWLGIAFALSIVLLSVHLYALQHYLYWSLRWFDIPMHIFGGATLGSFILAFGTSRRLTTYLLFMLAIVVGWEVFEFVGHISTAQPDYWIDTFKDMFDGIIGSLVMFFISRKTAWR